MIASTKRLLALAGAATVLILFKTCKKPDVDLQAIEINSGFEQSPPIAESVYIRPLEKSQVELTAQFPEGVINSNYHAIMVDGEKLVLRDDGGGADSLAGDRVFTIVVNEDFNGIMQELKTMVNEKFDTDTEHHFEYTDRSAVPLDQPKLTREIELLNKLEMFHGKIPLDPILDSRHHGISE